MCIFQYYVSYRYIFLFIQLFLSLDEVNEDVKQLLINRIEKEILKDIKREHGKYIWK